MSFFSISVRFCVGIFFAKSLAFAKVTASEITCDTVMKSSGVGGRGAGVASAPPKV